MGKTYKDSNKSRLNNNVIPLLKPKFKKHNNNHQKPINEEFYIEDDNDE